MAVIDGLIGAFLIIIVGIIGVIFFAGYLANKDDKERRKLPAEEQITFRYKFADNAPNVTRRTVQRLAEQLGIDENQVIHQALYEFAQKFSAAYNNSAATLNLS
jgi:hypothetical protein